MSGIEEVALPGMDDPPADGHVCDQCGTQFEHSGRGRPPKRCPECRQTRGRTTSTRTRTTAADDGDAAPRRTRGIEALEKNLRTQLAMLGVGVAFFDPFDSRIIVSRADQGAKALANLAATNPKIRKLLESSVEGAGYLPVALWLLATLLPIAAHHGLIRGVADPAATGRPSASPGGAPSPNGASLIDMDAVREFFEAK